MLARGDPLDGDVAVRGARLARTAARRAVATELESALSVGQLPLSERAPSQIDINREAVLAAEPAMESLIGRLRSPSPAHPRGVVLSRRIVRDGCGPLYQPAHSADLLHAVGQALKALDQPVGQVAGRAPTPCGSRPHSPSFR